MIVGDSPMGESGGALEVVGIDWDLNVIYLEDDLKQYEIPAESTARVRRPIIDDVRRTEMLASRQGLPPLGKKPAGWKRGYKPGTPPSPPPSP